MDRYTRRRKLSIEKLETRELLAGVPELLVDVNPGPNDSDSWSFTEVGDTIFFVANDGTHGEELWKSDGTAAGTKLVKDIYDGITSSNLGLLTEVNNTLYFRAEEPTYSREVWKSDGTEAGTTILKDLTPGRGGGRCPFIACLGGGKTLVSDLANINNTLYITTFDSLYKSDGTSDGTELIKKADVFQPSSLTALGDRVLFVGRDEKLGRELWITDGTTDETTVLMDTAPGRNVFGYTSPIPLAVIGDTLFFSADDSYCCVNSALAGHGRELWKTDGTSGGTSIVRDIWPGSRGRVLEGVATTDGSLFIVAEDQSHGFELWVSDGTRRGTNLVREIHPSDSKLSRDEASIPRHLTVAGNTLYFTADDGINGRELWKSDGTKDGTVMIKNIARGAYSSSPEQLTHVNGTLYFTATDEKSGRELWKSDGTKEGTVLVADLRPGRNGSEPLGLTAIGNRLLFSANDGLHGREPWHIVFSPGDSNLDGFFDQLDIVQVLQAEKYATGEISTFEDGDWNGDGVFDQNDIVEALQAGTYLQQSDPPIVDLSGFLTTFPANFTLFREPDVIRSFDQLTEAIPFLNRGPLEELVNFQTQDLLLFSWTGPEHNALTFEIDSSKVVFHYDQGVAKDLRPQVALFAIDKETEWKLSGVSAT